MTNQQGAPEALTDFEHRHAIRQGYEIAASDGYFEARPQIDSNDRRNVFRAGFERGWDRHAALVEAQQPAKAVPITVEQVEDAIGLQSTAWDTIGAEKIVEAVLRLANAQQPAHPEQQPFGWIKQSEIDSSKDFGGSINLWRRRYDCDVPVYLAQQPAPSAAAAKPECYRWERYDKWLNGWGWGDCESEYDPRLPENKQYHSEDFNDPEEVRNFRALYRNAPQPSPTPQADSQPAPQGETNVQLDIDSNPSTPRQQRNVAGPVALGQPVGIGPDQAAGHLSAQGDKLLTVAERNLRSFLRSAAFKSESDREAALNCVDVLYAAARAQADSVTAPAGGVVEYTPMLDDEGRAMVGTSHHYTADNIRALVAEYKALEAGGPDTWELYYNTDHRARAGVLWRVISALADEVPFAPTPPAQAADSVLEDAARWNEVLMHVGAAYHLGGQHFTLNTLRIRDQMYLLRGSVAQHFTACIDDSRAARKQGGAT